MRCDLGSRSLIPCTKTCLNAGYLSQADDILRISVLLYIRIATKENHKRSCVWELLLPSKGFFYHSLSQIITFILVNVIIWDKLWQKKSLGGNNSSRISDHISHLIIFCGVAITHPCATCNISLANPYHQPATPNPIEVRALMSNYIQ